MLKQALSTAGGALRSAVLTRVNLAPTTPFTLQAVRAFGADAGLSKSDVTERVMTVVKAFNKVEASKVTPTATFTKDLGLDSLDTVEVVMAFEEEFMIEIPDAEADKIASCEDAITYLVNHPLAK